MRRGVVAIAVAIAVGLLATGCGHGATTLERADRAMATLDAGTMSLELAATAGAGGAGGKPVGFRMSGPFSLNSRTTLPVFDLTYDQLLGATRKTTSVASTGDAVYVTSNGQTQQVPGTLAARLRMGRGGAGFTDLGVSGWVDHPRETTSGHTRVVTGTVDVVDLLGDLARVMSQVGGAGDGSVVPGADADRLRAMVRSSRIEVVTGTDDALPRRVHAVVDFGGTVPAALKQALGPYAAARLDLTLSLSRLHRALTVRPPR